MTLRSNDPVFYNINIEESIMKKYLIILVGLFVLSGCKDERPTIDVNSDQNESSNSVESKTSNESSDISSNEDKIVQAIEEMFQEELELELVEIQTSDDESTEAIPEPHKEYKIIPIDEDYKQSLLDSVYRIHNGTASPGERDIIRTIFDNVKEIASNLDTDNNAVSFEFRNAEDEPIVIAKSTRDEDFIQYDFDYQVEPNPTEDAEAPTEIPEENVEPSTDTFIPQPSAPSGWQNSENNESSTNNEESTDNDNND